MSFLILKSVRNKSYLNIKKMLYVSCLFGLVYNASAETEFNIDALDVADQTAIDISQFKDKDFILPGDYFLEIEVNKNKLPLQKISFYEVAEQENKGGVACLPRDVVEMMALTKDAIEKIDSWHQGECANLLALDGVVITNDIANGFLRIAVPQAWMKYSDPDWTPPEQWESGIAGAFVDYNVNGQFNDVNQTSATTVSSYGTLGVNYAAWRLRGNYQTNFSSDTISQRSSSLNSVYAYRPLPYMAAKLTIGEQQLNSQLIDGFRYTGINLANDERMLPPSLQGYAPQVSGIAKTNAKVTISQSGRVVYETNVPAGPFRIQELDSSVRGRLDVTVEEQDGSRSSFQVDTATVPYLTRPGYVRYNLTAGAPSEQGDSVHDIHGPGFITGDFSWGVANSWSLYGGSLMAGEYNSFGLGIGRDLYALGAFSADLTRSIADLPEQSTKAGQSFRVNYAKQFDDYNSAITFAGYRFSQKDFMTMSQFLSQKERLENSNFLFFLNDSNLWGNKESYNITANKTFWADDTDKSFTLFLDYNHRTYWDHAPEDRYGLSLNKSLSVAEFNNISLYLSAFRTTLSNNQNDDSITFSISVPFSDRKSIGYSLQSSTGRVTHIANYQDYSHQNNSYQLSAGVQSNGHAVSRGYYSHTNSIADVNLNASSVQNEFTSLGASIRGGMTLTEHGAALHQGGQGGGTRIMIDTGEASDISINNGVAVTNSQGLAVVSSITDYRKNDMRIDIDLLGNDVDTTDGIKERTLIEGSIGYVNFDIATGLKFLAQVVLPDGSHPPFGATVAEESGRVNAVVDEDGMIYLTGVKDGQSFDISWGGSRQCKITAPHEVNDFSFNKLTCK